MSEQMNIYANAWKKTTNDPTFTVNAESDALLISFHTPIILHIFCANIFLAFLNVQKSLNGHTKNSV